MEKTHQNIFKIFFIISLIFSLDTVLFGQVNLTSSNLPLLFINCDETIVREYYITAQMGIIYNGDDSRNFVTDPFNHYDGNIIIRGRGSSSWYFPKKQYRIETQQANGENLNVPLLGMPSENDWVLYGPYSDKSLIRNVLTYKLAREIGDWAPRTRFCEVFLNGDYIGVYVLTENIKRDEDRVDITKLLPEDHTEPNISGGYIFSRDRIDGGESFITTNRGLELKINEPDEDEITATQKNWLKSYIDTFESALYNNYGDYNDYIDVLSFVDNFLLVEFAKNIDGYRLSTFFYKDRNDKIIAGPAWDYNLSFGNADYNYGWDPQGWYWNIGNIGKVTKENRWDFSYWFTELLTKPEFNTLCKERWLELRQNEYNKPYIFNLIDKYVATLNESRVRNFLQWPILGEYVWPNPGFPESGSYGFDSPTTGGPTSWPEEIEFLKYFIENRLHWIDDELGVEITELTLDIIESGQGKIIYQDQLITELTEVGAFPKNTQLEMNAIPTPGYQFVRWEETALESNDVKLINKGASWKYLDDGSNQSTSWYGVSFDDSGWNEGLAEFGYGDGDETTTISYGPDGNNKHITTYFRTTFNINSVQGFSNLTLKILRDDGAVIYLNGSEIVRTNMPSGIIDYNTLATDYVSGSDESTFFSFSVPSSQLVDGTNTLAVEIHQNSSSSSDLSFDFELTAVNDGSATSNIIGTSPQLSYLITNDNSKITAIFESDGSTPPSIVINEIHYNPKDCENCEFIEIFNVLDSVIDLSNYTFTSGIDFTFPNNTKINPGEYILIARDKTLYENNGYQVFQWTESSLTDNGELIKLCNNELTTVDSVVYNSQSPWPVLANGESLELINASLNNELAYNWQASYYQGGTPGEANIRIIEDLYINEFLASNTVSNHDEYGEFDDWIEIFNNSQFAIDLGGLYLSDDTDNPLNYQIPNNEPSATTILPDSFIVLWADNDTATGALHLGFNLRRSGESISIVQKINGQLNFIDSLTYSGQTTDISSGRIPDGSNNWHLFPVPTPGVSNHISKINPEDQSVSGNFLLNQNYPNPFNPSTKITYHIPHSETVTIKLFNIMGQHVFDLVNSKKEAGIYTISLDGSELSSGVYLYLMEAGDFKNIKKCILMK